MRSNISEIVSLRYIAPYGDTFIHRSYQGLGNSRLLNYSESRASATWVFVSSSCPYKSIRSKGLYSGREYFYILNKYGNTEIDLRYYL